MNEDVTEKRKDYYKRCQDIADYIYKTWKASGRFISENELTAKFGQTDYNAFMHEINVFCPDQSMSALNEAIEWIWKSRYFANKEMLEKRNKESHDRSGWAIWIAVASMVISLVALIHSFCQ